MAGTDLRIKYFVMSCQIARLMYIITERIRNEKTTSLSI